MRADDLVVEHPSRRAKGGPQKSPGLPPRIEQAAREARSRNLKAGMKAWATLGLWLPNSWATAKRMGISEEEYVRWINLGLWNLDGDPGTREDVAAYRAIAGPHGWILAAAGLSPQQAAAQAQADGVSSVVESAQALIALQGLAEDLPEEDRWISPELASQQEDPEPPPLNFG